MTTFKKEISVLASILENVPVIETPMVLRGRFLSVSRLPIEEVPLYQ